MAGERTTALRASRIVPHTLIAPGSVAPRDVLSSLAAYHIFSHSRSANGRLKPGYDDKYVHTYVCINFETTAWLGGRLSNDFFPRGVRRNARLRRSSGLSW